MPVKKKELFFLSFFFVLLLGIIIRIWNIEKNPSGFFCDEASIGYNAYSILHSAKDEYGNFIPLFFKAFGEYKNPVDIYSTIPFVAVFGLNELSVRMTSTFFSILTIFVFYFIGKKLFGSGGGLLFMLVYSITPWAIHMARINLEGFNQLIFFISLAILFQIKFYKNQKLVYLILNNLLLGVATYCYFPARIIIPLFVFINDLIILTQSKKIKWPLISMLSYLLIISPLINHLFFGQGLSRWGQVSLFNEKNINPFFKIIQTYLLHFSPDFLFLKGDIGMTGQFITRHSIRGIGELFLWQLPFVIVGIYFLMSSKLKIFPAVILLLLLFPIPSSLTADRTPQATRSIVGIVPLTLLTCFGLVYFFKLIQKIKNCLKYFIVLLLGTTIFLLFFNFIKLFNNYPSYSSDYWGWQYGPKEIVSYFLSTKEKYDELYMTSSFNEPDFFFKFYDPENKCNNCYVGGFDRLNSSRKQLFALRPNEFPKIKNKIKKTIYYPSGEIAFYIVDFGLR